MRIPAPIHSVILILMLLVSLSGQGLVMLCEDESGDHSAFERTTAQTCPVKTAADNCGEDELHFDDPLNHAVEVRRCNDLLIELSDFHSYRSDDAGQLLHFAQFAVAVTISDFTMLNQDRSQIPLANCPRVSGTDSFLSTTVLLS